MRLPRFVSPSLVLSVAVVSGLAGCRSASDGVVPMSVDDHVSRAARASEDSNLGRIDDPALLFVTLQLNIRSYRDMSRSNSVFERGSLNELVSMEEAMTRLVYNNFDAVLEAMNAEDPDRRVTAAAALGFSRIASPGEPGFDPRFPPVHERAVAPLVATLEEGNDLLTQNALASLYRIGSLDTPKELMLEMLLSHHSPEVRSNAALVLGRVLDARYADLFLGPLYAALEDSEPIVRSHVIGAIASLRDPGAKGQILRVYRDDTVAGVRAHAARALGNIGDLEVVPHLASGLVDKDWMVRVSSYNALMTIAGEDLGKHPRPWMEWYESEAGRS